MGTLRRRMEQELRLRGRSERTVKSYVDAVARFAGYHGRPPDQLGVGEVHAFLVHLVEERGLSASSVNQALSALKFFYRDVLGREMAVTRLPRPKRTRPLPVVLTEAEVTRLLRAPMSLRMRTLLMTLYSAALRLQEGIRLRPEDIDSESMSILVRQGKGARDRRVMLAANLLVALRAYWRVYRPGPWLFYGQVKERPIDARSVQKAVRRAAEQAGLRKRVTPHTLRHSCATHLLEQGASLRHIQELLGHKSLKTTQRYTQVAPGRIAAVLSPLDRLPVEQLTSDP